MENYDVVVIGGGPAGCAAAICARQVGLSALLLDHHDEPKTSPGETLHPGVEPIFEILGARDAVLAADFRRHYGVWTERKSQQRIFQPYGHDGNGAWRGYQADRKKLHKILLEATIAAGVNVLRPEAPRAVQVDRGRLVGIELETRECQARWILDATGRQAWLARKMSLTAERQLPELRVSFGWTDTQMPELDDQPLFRQHTSGWDWYAPIEETRVAWVKLRFAKWSKEADRFDKKGVDLTWRIYRKCAGPGYFLLGDSAALLDPASSTGVLRAMMSGIFSIHLVKKIINHRMNEQLAQLVYRKWVGDMFDQTTERLRQQLLLTAT